MIDLGTWRKPRRQVAALPYREGPDERLQILLVTSRETRRWVIPKGWPVKGLKPAAAAAREAQEEAGLVGRVGKRAIGAYRYEKRLKNGATALCEVQVFPLEVLRQRKNFREKNQREPRWAAPAIAADLVEEPELKALILAFARELEHDPAEAAPEANTSPPPS
jgi:8-oxo-dGTP pyrophosphatase MutT (NUDIX family)